MTRPTFSCVDICRPPRQSTILGNINALLRPLTFHTRTISLRILAFSNQPFSKLQSLDYRRIPCRIYFLPIVSFSHRCAIALPSKCPYLRLGRIICDRRSYLANNRRKIKSCVAIEQLYEDLNLPQVHVWLNCGHSTQATLEKLTPCLQFRQLYTCHLPSGTFRACNPVKDCSFAGVTQGRRLHRLSSLLARHVVLHLVRAFERNCTDVSQACSTCDTALSAHRRSC